MFQVFHIFSHVFTRINLVNSYMFKIFKTTVDREASSAMLTPQPTLGDSLKKFFVLILFVPLMGIAQQFNDDFDIPGSPVNNEELGGVITTPTLNCGKHSDMFCFGRRPSNVCVVDPSRNHTGICRQIDQPNRNGQVSCRCL